jgi:Fic family protein
VFLFEHFQGEGNAVYQQMEVENTDRLYSFLVSVIEASVAIQRQFLSESLLKAMNFHGTTCLHWSTGQYRPCEVAVGTHSPVPAFMVPAQMEEFVNFVNANWAGTDPLALGAFVLWRLNFIHPFFNGNGRTARAACYFVICAKLGGALPGATILPELLRQNRDEYVQCLERVDASLTTGLDLSCLVALIRRLLAEQTGVDPTLPQN